MYQKTIESSPGVDFNTPALRRKRSLRFLKDKLAHWAVAIGGLGVIAAITLIFFYLVYEVAPLFKSASMTPVSTWSQTIDETRPSLYMSMEEQGEIALGINRSGELNFSSTQTGLETARFYLPLPANTEVLTLANDPADSRMMVAGLSNGQAIVFKIDHKISWPNDKRVITPVVDYPYGEQLLDLSDTAIDQITIGDESNQLFIGGISNDKLVSIAFSKEENFLTEEVTLEQKAVKLPAIPGIPKQLLIDPDQRWLYIQMVGDEMAILNVANLNRPFVHSVTDLTTDNAKVTEIQFLLGGSSLLIGDDSGLISQWFLVRDDDNNWSLQRIRDFKLSDNPVATIQSEFRRKGFIAADTEGNVGIFYTTAGRTLITRQLVDGPINQMAISPRSNYLLINGQGETQFLKIENDHPEVSFSALWEKVWYEGYENPEYICSHQPLTMTSNPSSALCHYRLVL